MAGIVIALGALMVVGGIACIAMGAPYLVLERGFTLAIIGSVLASAGLVMIAQGLVLRELRRKGARTALAAADQQTAPGASAAAIGAGSLGAGLIAAGASMAEPAPGQDATQEQDAAPVDDRQQELPFPEQAIADAAPEAETAAPAAELPAEPAEGRPDATRAISPPADSAEMPDADAPAEAPAVAQNSAPDMAEDAEEDPFEKLRRSLMADREEKSSALSLPKAAGLAPAPPPEDVPAPETMPDAAPPEAPMPDPADQAAPEEDTLQPEDPSVQEAPQPDDAPGHAVSDEGIVSVRRIGEATYTMFADGTVLAETPAGARRFATVADLKAHLAAGGG